jgi:DNA repair photolyase
VTPILEHHLFPLTHSVSVGISRKDKRRRIGVGDWIEYKGGDSRLTEQIGKEWSPGRVVGEDMLKRPRIRWYTATGEWSKPYSLFDESSVRVLFDFQAAEHHPEAFNSYPAEVGAKTVSPNPPEAVKAAVVSIASTIEEAVPEAANEKDGCRMTPTSSPLVLISSGFEATEENGETAGIKGCSFIYAPRGQAGEYAPLACNPYRGCGHKCAYCYVPQVIKMKREEFDAGAVPRPDFLRNLEKDAAKYQEAGYGGQVMLSFTTDPYHPGDTTLTRQTIECLQRYGMGVCTLTKGGTRSLRDLDLFRPGHDAFASTLTSLDDAFSLKWERAAALPGDRIEALKAFHDRGIFTWVSLEPTLDCESSLEIVERTHEYVDLYKIGRVNYLPMTKTTDWRDYTVRMMELCAKLKVAHYFKKDLQQYLPNGYVNLMRHEQHR